MLRIVVHDNPQPQGSKSAFAVRKAGGYANRSVVVEDNPKVRTWREAVKEAALGAMEADPGAYPMEGPLVLAITFTLSKPKSRPKTKPSWPDVRPDISKLLRSTEDALTASGVYKDDSQIVEYARLAKSYPIQSYQHGTADLGLGPGASVMFALGGTCMDVLHIPGAVIRIARMSDFPQMFWGANA